VKISRISSIITVILAITIILSACTMVDGTTVATVNGTNITKSQFTFYLTQVKAQIEQQQNTESAADFWETAEVEGKKALDAAKEKALDEAIKAALIEKRAKENNLKLSQEDIASIGKQKSSMITKLGGREAYRAELKKNGLTESSYSSLLENSVYGNKLMEKLTTEVDENAAKAYYNEKVVRVKHVLVMTVDAQNQPLPKEQQDAAKTKADEILAKAKQGEDFDKLVAELSEDPGSKSQPDGYYIGKGFALGQQGGMVPSFEKASLELAVGGISEIVETSYGYHIIKRYENQPEEFDKNKEEILSRTKSADFEKLLVEWKAAATIKVNEKQLKSIK